MRIPRPHTAPLAVAVLVIWACEPTSRGVRVGETVVLPRRVHCSIDMHDAKEPIQREHRVIGTVEVWGASDQDGLARQVQLRACELGADAVINLAPSGDTWRGDAVVWLSEVARPPVEPEPRPPPPPPPVEDPPPPPPVEPDPRPEPKVEEPEDDSKAKGKRKGKGKGKGKRKKRRRRR